MQRIIFSLFIILVLFACKQLEEKYVNHDKWRSLASFGYHSDLLKGHPVEVIDSEFSHISDTVFSSNLTGKLNVRFVVGYNVDGDMITLRSYMDSLIFTGSNSSYTDQGPQHVFFSSTDSNKRETISKKIGPGKYQSDKFDNGKIYLSDIFSISEHGKKIVTERWKDKKFLHTTTEYFNNAGQFERIIQNSEFITEYRFYYSDQGFLDSLITTLADTRSKSFFINNEYGDPVYLEKSEGSVVEERRWWKYEYDSMHNWIRRIGREETDRQPSLFGDKEKYPQYSLVTRSIKYR